MSRGSKVEQCSVLVNGQRMAYQKAGRGPAVVLVHGLVGSALNWEENLLALARQSTVYAVDLLNMGGSDRVAGADAGLGAEADRLAAFLDALDLRQADFVGHSHGGAVAMMLAARHSVRVRRLILFAPANPFCQQSRGVIRFYKSALGAWFARCVPFLPRAATRVALNRMYGDRRKVSPTALGGYVGQFNRGSVDRVLNVVNAWWEDMAALRAELAQVAEVPVLLIWGDQDPAVGLSSGRQLANALGARLMVLNGVGHLPFAESPATCNAAMSRWLQEAA